MKERKIYDALIVGSGASGGWVAKELTERGMEVLMLEAGPPRFPGRDFTEHVWPYQLKFRGFGDRKRALTDQPVQSLCYACDEYSHQFFINDSEHPYTFPPEKPFMWIRGRQVGGKTFCWARESYRYSDFEFKAASRDGYEQDWPFSYADLEPYYDKVESFIGVSASYEGLPQMPDGKFLPPMNLSCGAVHAKQVIEKRFRWRVMPDRVANLTLPHNGRPACHYCDQCQRGCYTASYFNSPSVTLPAAARTGRFTLVPDAVVSHVLMNREGKAEGVHYVDRVTKKDREARARIVVLAAATLESTRILLNSRSPRFPNGVGNSSGILGHYLMDHFTIEGAGGEFAELQSSEREPVGNPCGYLIPKYVNAGGVKNRNFLRGYRFDGDASQELYSQAFSFPGFGRTWRERVRREIPYRFSIEAQGECLPRYDNYVELDPERKDAWGIPALRIHASYGENERAMAKAMRQDIGDILEALQVKNTSPPSTDLSVFGKNIHECGTARMGMDPKMSVLNRYNQVHDAKNVFVTDGAAFVTQGCYEPTLTIMAISARAADYMADAYKKGEL
ncbi:MAG: GMC family oxidoreductase [Acidobacteriaceae bacterium]|nr:GMC family oxidoreductase [Acidobacteriaceae bacterium]MBV9781026.1 GMC family oxidoreductase [Acidobacteriaceae bacterium]